MADFETTVYDNQESTEVWAAAVVELSDEKELVHVWNNIDDMFKFFVETRSDCVFYFHNLKFDGEFIISHIMNNMKFKPAYTQWVEDDINSIRWNERKWLRNNEFLCSISNRGQWYTITIKYKGHILEIRDSLKLLPFSVKRIGNSFKTKHRKTNIEYKGYRKAYGEITPEERGYIANDVLVVKEALELMISQGHTRNTIGSCCMKEFKESIKSLEFPLPGFKFHELFPNLYDYKIDKEIYGYDNAGDYIKRAYRGGWCYLVPEKANKIYKNGLTADVNSLYPSVMHSDSGNRYPFGLPTFWNGNYIPDYCNKENAYYYIKIRTRFYLKDGYLPFVQIKNDYAYKGTECLVTSDIWDFENQQYNPWRTDKSGNSKLATVELTLTMTDFELLKEHYELYDFEILSGCCFSAVVGMFDPYINKWAKIKKESKDAVRELAKLFLNNLYGRLATNTNSSFKVPVIKENGVIGYLNIEQYEKEPGYIACGAAVTSYARYFTITHAQKNYHGPDAPGFIYADTDSIHCDLSPEDLVEIKVHPTNFNSWKLESYWDKAIFVRQKTYIEHNTHSDGGKIEPYYNIKCAGLPSHCKNLFLVSMENRSKTTLKQMKVRLAELEGKNVEDIKLDEYEKEFLYNRKPVRRSMEDFKVGIVIPGKLRPKRMPGGIVLENSIYKMR